MAYFATRPAWNEVPHAIDDDLVDVAQVVVGDPHLVEDEPAVVVQATEHGVGHGLRLLVDLLEHEELVAALLGGGEVPVDVVLLDVARVPVEVGDGDAVPAQLDDLVLAELDGLPGVRDERGDVGGQEVLALASADDQRRVSPRADDDVGGVDVGRDEGEGALEPLADGTHRGGQVDRLASVDPALLLEQVRHRLGVGLAGQLVTALGELGAQLGEVLDDAVVDDRDRAGAVDVRVGVAVVGGAVGGPPGVTDAGGRRPERVLGQGRLEVGELAGALLGHQLAVADQRDSSRVVAAVLEPPQTLDHDPQGRLLPHVPHDAAHG